MYIKNKGDIMLKICLYSVFVEWPLIYKLEETSH